MDRQGDDKRPAHPYLRDSVITIASCILRAVNGVFFHFHSLRYACMNASLLLNTVDHASYCRDANQPPVYFVVLPTRYLESFIWSSSYRYAAIRLAPKVSKGLHGPDYFLS